MGSNLGLCVGKFLDNLKAYTAGMFGDGFFNKRICSLLFFSVRFIIGRKNAGGDLNKI